MKLWAFIITTLFLQEPASTDAAIFLVRQNHINLLLINLFWLIATAIDITVGYLIGKWIQKNFSETKFERWAEKWASKIKDFIGRKGGRFAMILLGVINYPYANAFIFSWLKVSFRNIFVLTLIGDLIYWITEWIINISVRNYFSNPHTVLFIVIGIGLLISVISKTILTKVLRKSF